MNEQTAPQKVTGIGPMLHNLRRKSRLARLFVLCIPPIIQNVCNKLLVAAQQRSLPELPAEFAALPFAQHALLKLTRDYDFERVLDIGAGAGLHSNVLAAHGKKVTALDFGASIYADKLDTVQEGVTRVEANFYEVSFDQPFDCCWASHVLEHQPDPGRFLRRCIELTREGGVIAITVPPLDDEVCGGHLTTWNAGLLLYQLVFAGLDCRDAAICSIGYNVSVIVRVKRRPEVELSWDNGDIRRLREFFPAFVTEPFNGRVSLWNW